jgi:hypothetical protein
MAFDAQGKWVPEDDSVSTQLTGLLNTNSDYMKTARAAGQRTAQKRGLLNSSIAAGAAQSAAISAAAPIASQDAQQLAQKNQAVIEGGINSGLSKQQFEQQGQLNTQQNTAAQQLQQMQDAAAKEREQLQIQGATDQQLAEFDQRTKEQQANIQAQADLQEKQLSSAERTALLSSDTSLRQSQIAANSQLSGQYLDAFASLAANPKIPASTRNAYIQEFQRILSQGQDLINVVQYVPLDWGAGANTNTATPPASSGLLAA